MTPEQLLNLRKLVDGLGQLLAECEAQASGVCLHPNAVDISTYENPGAKLCPDCDAGMTP